MGLASLDGQPFDIDPSSVSWTFETKTSESWTVGGKVVQVYGTRLNDMVVEGEFGSGGWQAQSAFLDRMRVIGDRQVSNQGGGTMDPVRFLFPQADWDFMVYLKSYTSGAGSRSVHLDAKTFNPRYRLSFVIVEDNTAGLKEAAVELFIRRISRGIGWSPNVYSGPMTWQQLQDAISPHSIKEYIVLRFDTAAAAVVGATLASEMGGSLTGSGAGSGSGSGYTGPPPGGADPTRNL